MDALLRMDLTSLKFEFKIAEFFKRERDVFFGFLNLLKILPQRYLFAAQTKPEVPEELLIALAVIIPLEAFTAHMFLQQLGIAQVFHFVLAAIEAYGMMWTLGSYQLQQWEKIRLPIGNQKLL